MNGSESACYFFFRYYNQTEGNSSSRKQKQNNTSHTDRERLIKSVYHRGMQIGRFMQCIKGQTICRERLLFTCKNVFNVECIFEILFPAENIIDQQQQQQQ